jgi:hypothetical protein
MILKNLNVLKSIEETTSSLYQKNEIDNYVSILLKKLYTNQIDNELHKILSKCISNFLFLIENNKSISETKEFLSLYSDITELIITLNPFIITYKDKNGKNFHIKLQSDFIDELSKVNNQPFKPSESQDTITESQIINMIKNGIEFKTYNILNNDYTIVNVIQDNIKTNPNKTKLDNIENLPLFK